MKCTVCGRTIQEGDHFCSYCGNSADARPLTNKVYCPNCGNALTESENFCGICGAPRQPSSDFSQHHRQRRKQPGPRTPRPKRGRKWIIPVAVLLVLVGGLSLWFFLPQSDTNGQPNEMLTRDGRSVMVYQTSSENIVTDSETGTHFVNNELLVYVNESVSRAQVEAFAASQGGTIAGFDEWLNKYQIQIGADATLKEIESLRDVYAASGLFRDVRINLAFPAETEATFTPDDSEWRWTWGAQVIRAPEMWAIEGVFPGTYINVGVLDNQFYTEHEDLVFSRTYFNAFDIHDDRHGESTDHGTHVAGTIAAVFNNGNGIAGIAPNVNLYGASMLGLTDRSVKTNESMITISDIEAGLTALILYRRMQSHQL